MVTESQLGQPVARCATCMGHALDVASTALRWAWKSAVPLAAIAIILSIGSERDRVPAECSGKHGRVTVSDDGECIRITLDPPAKKGQLSCFVRGAGGEETLSLIVSKGGNLHFWLDPASPIRVIGGRRTNGAVFHGVDNGNVALQLQSYPDGSSDVTVIESALGNREQPAKLFARFRVTKEGRVTHEVTVARKESE